ncbi:MAG: hypothetical protein BWZ01_01906 [Deltaproteobacteria bacterium ADurb.BinA179]|nr:MAG: hypothetical protein BWZ01_01906 [Deltaproteobacteria bacterium ADurb.BinA179]
MSSGPAAPPPARRERDARRVVDVYRNDRTNMSDMKRMEPSMVAATVMYSTSRFMMWPISWATTPWSSSLSHRARRPAVTQMQLFSGDLPTANALGEGSSTTNIRGI